MAASRTLQVTILAMIALCWLSCKPVHRLAGTHKSVSIPSFKPKDSIARRIYMDSLFMSAEAAKLKGDVKKAISNFTLLLHFEPDNATASFELSRLFLQLQNAGNCLLFARKAAGDDTANRWFQLNYADALALNKKYAEAANVFIRLSARYPDEPEYLYNAGVLLANEAKYSEALQLFDSIERRDGISEESIYQKQRIYLKEHNLPAAAAEIRKLISAYPDEPRYYALLAEAYRKNNLPDSSLAVYKRLLQKYPDNPQALIAVGLNYKRQGNDSAYYQYMSRAFTNPALDIEDKINFVSPFLKYVEVDSSQKGEALRLCRMVVQAHPDDARAYALYAGMLLQCRETDSAMAQYNRSLQLDSSDIEVWQQVLRIYSAENKNDSVQRISRIVMHSFPDNFIGFYFNGVANVLLRNSSSGIQSLRKALDIGINDRNMQSEAYALLGEAYNNVHNYTASDSCFDRSLLLVPNNDMVLNNYSYYLSERGEQLDKALRMSKASLELNPDNYVYEDTYAWVLYKTGKYNEAKKWMEKALSHKETENSPGYLEHYGDILYKLNEVDKAVKYWQMAKASGASSYMLDKKIAERKLVEVPPVHVLNSK